MRLASLLGLALLSLAFAPAPFAQTSPPETRTASFSMYCYWTGEATLGKIDGVLASRIGHWGGDEIVQVDYDPAVTDLVELVSALKSQGSFYSVIASDPEQASAAARSIDPSEIARIVGSPRFIEPKHSLRTRHPEIFALGLTERQAILLNSWSYFGGEMPEVLTEEQIARLLER